MGIAVIGTTFVDVKGHPHGKYVPAGRNAGRVIEVHGGVARNIAEDIANVGLAPAFVSVVDESGLSDDIVGRLAQRGCNTSYIGRAEGGLGMWLAIFDEAGDVVASISRRPPSQARRTCAPASPWKSSTLANRAALRANPPSIPHLAFGL